MRREGRVGSCVCFSGFESIFFILHTNKEIVSTYDYSI